MYGCEQCFVERRDLDAWLDLKSKKRQGTLPLTDVPCAGSPPHGRTRRRMPQLKLQFSRASGVGRGSTIIGDRYVQGRTDPTFGNDIRSREGF